jgi:NAD(P)-dependent dehydrogenase (short-subunit alcohol dehydrogenase family)
VASYRRREQLEAALDGLDSNERARFRGVYLELTDPDSISAAADEAEAAFGKVHVLCNNAGTNFFAPADEATTHDWESIMAVNFFAVTRTLSVFLPRIRSHGQGGHILNTGSMASFIAVPHAAPYTAAKFALRGLTEALYFNLRPQGIGVSLLCPGLVRTNIVEAICRHGRENWSENKTTEERMQRVRRANEAGMDPLEVGEKAVRGIERGWLYILTHAEFGEELEEIHREIIAAVPDEQVPLARLEMERARRGLKAS